MIKAFLVQLSLVCCVFALFGCGKKANNDKKKREVNRDDITVDEEYLEKQDVSCENGQSCPNFIAKIVVKKNSGFEFCTGFLTEENVIATSTSCLPAYIRLGGQDCSRDVTIFFPKTSNRPKERISCVKVLQVSELEGDDPILWRDDVSFLQLGKAVPYRRQAQIAREGVLDNKTYSTWILDQQDEYSGIIRKFNCDTIHRNFINPLALNEYSPSVMFAGCPFTKGGSGAPVVDTRMRVRAVISKPLDTQLRLDIEKLGLLFEGLRDMVHATNFACAPTPQDSNVQDEECHKELSLNEVDRLRAEMQNTNMVIGDLKRKYEEMINTSSKIIRFGVKLIIKGNEHTTEIYPRCFKPTSEWLPSVSGTRGSYTDKLKIPVRTFKKAMDQNARIIGQIQSSPEKNFNVKFSVKDIKEEKASNVSVWFDGENERKFSKISEACSSLL